MPATGLLGAFSGILLDAISSPENEPFPVPSVLKVTEIFGGVQGYRGRSAFNPRKYGIKRGYRAVFRPLFLPVTQEIAGPNPVEGACDDCGAVRKLAKRPSSNLGDCGFNSRLRHSINMRRLGIGEPKWL